MNKKDKIVYGHPARTMDEQKKTINISEIRIDNFTHYIHIVTQKGSKVESFDITMECAQTIGFINIDALKQVL